MINWVVACGFADEHSIGIIELFGVEQHNHQQCVGHVYSPLIMIDLWQNVYTLIETSHEYQLMLN